MLTPEEQAAIKRAEDFSPPVAAREIRKPCAIVPAENLRITTVDEAPAEEFGMPGKDIIFIAPGKHVLSATLPENSASSSGPLEHNKNIEVICENGKHYNMTSKMGWIRMSYSFSEITDPAALSQINQAIRERALYVEKEKAGQRSGAAYLSFSRRNPNLLSGKWRIGDKEGELELEFNKNKVTWTGKHVHVESTFLFNENTIITMWDRTGGLMNLGIPQTRASQPNFLPAKMVWYYHLSGNTLEVKGNVPANLQSTYNLTGAYKRVK